jgi:hypothetical protein
LDVWDYFMIPVGGISDSKAMPLRGNGFCCFEYSHEQSEGGGLLHDPFLGSFRQYQNPGGFAAGFLSSKLAEASFARSENKKPTIIRGF